MRNFNLFGAIVLLSAVLGRPAGAVVLDFESLAFSGFPTQTIQTIPGTPTTYSEGGFTLSTTGFGFARYGTLSDRFPGSTALVNNTVTRDTVLTQDGGGAFSISGISLATTDVVSGTFDLLFTGTKSDSTTVNQIFTISNETYAMQNFLFSAGFTDLVSLSWTQGSPSHQFDNIVLNEAAATVSAPVTSILFLSGFLALGAIRRRGR